MTAPANQSESNGLVQDHESECRSDSDSSDDPFIGQIVLDRYKVVELSGSGGWGKVYRGLHLGLGTDVAIKIIHKHLANDESSVKRLEKEAILLSRLDSHYIVRILDFGRHPAPLIVMEYFHGTMLSDWLKASGPMKPELAVELFLQICDGLSNANSLGLVHRDLKPGNVLVIIENSQLRSKLLDFGIAKMVDEATNNERLTCTGEIIGSPPYMSPEQWTGTADHRSDLYSLGCIMFEVLTGQPAFNAQYGIEFLNKHLNTNAPRLSELMPNIDFSGGLDDIAQKCLQKQAENRYQSSLELQGDLELVKAKKKVKIKLPESQDFKKALNTAIWRFSCNLLLASGAILAAGLCFLLFVYSGPDGNKGTLFNKLMWQLKTAEGDNLLRQQKYLEAVNELNQARELASKLGDEHKSLEITLRKLGVAYGLEHDYADQELVNHQIAQLNNERISGEFEDLMAILDQWDSAFKRDSGKTQGVGQENGRNAHLEFAMQSPGLVDRINRCADQLFAHMEDKQTALLSKAISVFEEMGDWKAGVSLRVYLAHSFHQQQRLVEEGKLLQEAVKNCAEKPSSSDEWRAKILAKLRLGHLDRMESMGKTELQDRAREELETALEWTRANFPDDKELMKECLHNLVTMYRLCHSKEYEEKANTMRKEEHELDAQNTLD